MLSRRTCVRWLGGVAGGALALLLVLPAEGRHGGRFRGPGLPPPAFGTVGATEPAGRRLRSADPEGWSQWWAFERDAYLGGGARPPVDVEWVQGQVVPALLANLEGPPNGALLSASLVALAKLGVQPAPDGAGQASSPPLEETLLGYVQHGNQEVAEAAVVALGLLGDRVAAPLLGTLLEGEGVGRTKQPSLRQRALAAYGLGAIGRRATAEAVRRYCVYHLTRALLARPELPAEIAVGCVVALGHVRLPLAGVDEDDPADALTPSDSRGGQLALLHALLQDGSLDPQVRAFVPVALARLVGDVPVQREVAMQEFAGRLEREAAEDAAVRAGCVQALGMLVTPQQMAVDEIARASLLRLARDGSRLERGLALVGLGRMAGRQAEGLVGGVVEQVRGLLIERLSEGKSQERPWAAVGLGLLEHGARRDGKAVSERAVEALRTTLEATERPDLAGALCVALGLTGELGAEAQLTGRLERGDERQRGYAAAGLGLLGARGALPALRAQALAGHRPQVAREAAAALGRMGDRASQGALLDEAYRARFSSHRISALLSAGLVGDARGAAGLLAFSVDKEQSPLLRAYATVALGTILDPDPSPWTQAAAAGTCWWAAPVTLYDPDSGLGLVDVF